MGSKSLHLKHHIPNTGTVDLQEPALQLDMCFSQYFDLYIISIVLYSFIVFVLGDNICQTPPTILVHSFFLPPFSLPLSLSFSF